MTDSLDTMIKLWTPFLEKCSHVYQHKIWHATSEYSPPKPRWLFQVLECQVKDSESEELPLLYPAFQCYFRLSDTSFYKDGCKFAYTITEDGQIKKFLHMKLYFLYNKDNFNFSMVIPTFNGIQFNSILAW